MCQASKAMFTERLDLVPSEDERDLDRYVTDLLLTHDFYFQYGFPYSDELVNNIDFHSSGVIYYSLFLRDTQTMVGYVGLLPDETDPAGGEIEYYIFRDFRRQGYAKEALSALIGRFFSGVLTGVRGERVEAVIHADNDASRRLLERLGFTKEAFGMRISLGEDGEVDMKRSAGLCKYGLDAKTDPPLPWDNKTVGRRGVFWVVDGLLLAFPFQEGDRVGAAKSGKTYNHKKLWEEVRPKGCKKPFDYYPRGRVELSRPGVPILYMSPHVEESLIPEIKAAFGLKRDPAIHYDHSEHYWCYLDEGYQKGRLRSSRTSKRREPR